MAEGQTATNPQTGQRVVLRGGQWVHAGGASTRPSGHGSATRQAAAPRGIRNNNPGNIEDGPFARSLPGYTGSDGRFATFDSPDAGNAAKTQLLGSYINRGFNTPASIINRWAPPSDNNPTSSYAQYVAQRAGIGVNDVVTAEQIPLIAQAINEFENGNTQPVGAPQPTARPSAQEGQTATNPQTGEKVVYQGGQWVSQPSAPTEGTPLNTDIKDGVWVGDVGGDNWQYVSRERAERMNDPEYQRAFAEAQRGSANVPDALRAFGQGQSLGFLDEVNALAQGGLQGLENVGRQVRGEEIEYGMGAATQAARDAERDAQAQYASENPIANFGLQMAGGLATPGLAAGGNYIAGAQGVNRLGRASQVGAGYGAAAGFGNAEGDALERVPGMISGGLVGAGAGVIGQAGVDRLARGSATRAASGPSNARILSREGVDLTPGQMMSEVPVIGNVVRSLEEGASSIPFVGAPIAGARQQSVETFNRAALNRVLEPLGQRLPRNVRAGYGAVEDAQQRVSRAYDDALSGVRLVPDEAMYDGLGRAINDAVENSGVTGARRVTRDISERVFRVLGDYADNPISGQQFKNLESEFGNLASTALESSDGATRAVGRAYQSVNDTLRRTLREQNPQAADDLRAANSAYARLMRVERAAASSVTQGSDGVFSPTQLGMAVAQAGSRRANARGDALMQDLAVAGRNIIPSRTGDSGTATRGAITGGVAAMASGVPIAGTVAIPVIASSIAYSRPAQALLNAAYRATDYQAATEALVDLGRIAQRDPALVPYYEGAVQHVLGLFQPDRPTTPPAQPVAQAPTSALQMATQ